MTHHHHGHPGGEHAEDAAALGDLLDLDAEVLAGFWGEVVDLVGTAAPADVRRVLDIGAGTGTGTFALARRFPDAEVIAVDASDGMLARIRGRAAERGLGDRIRTLLANLDEAWPAVGPCDVTWASMSVHHLGDPDRVLREICSITRPGGVVALVEFAEPLRFLRDDIGFGRSGLEDRLIRAWHDAHAQELPDLGSDWAVRLAAAGFVEPEVREFAVALDPPHATPALEYARQWLLRNGSRSAGILDADDRATLEVLAGGDGPLLLRRGELVRISGSRTVTIARRP